jgi:hypothetical protein
MIDTHLIYVALTVFGGLAGAAIAISALIVVIGTRQHRTRTRGTLTTTATSSLVHREPALR